VKNTYTENAGSAEGTEKRKKERKKKEAPRLLECGAGENAISDKKTKYGGDHLGGAGGRAACGNR
jgi:hypothetical protein